MNIKPKKILHVVHGMDPVLGGVCKAVRTIATSLNKVGVINEVVSLDDPKSDFIRKDSFILHAIGAAENPWGHNKNLIPWLEQNITQFDLVVIHGLWQYCSFAVYKVLKTIKKETKLELNNTKLPKCFVMPHGMLDPYFQKAPDRKIKAIRNWFYWKIIESKVVNNSDGLLFTCDEERKLAKEPFRPYRPKKQLIVGLGVDVPPSYQPKMDKAFLDKCEGLNDLPYFLFLSRIHEKKGVDLLIKAYTSIIEKKSKNDIPALVIAGPGVETDYGNKIVDLVSKNSILKDKVFFPGMLSGDEKWGAFYNCENFVLPSHQENFGIAIVEALACNKPVLITDKINIWREIEESGAGIIRNDTLEGIIELLESWINLSKDEKKAMTIKSKKCFENYFSIESSVNRWGKNLLNEF